jgi:GT2 family glycosyltransferase
MDLSICIVSWNVAGDLRRCLASIRAQRGAPRFETIVVDNASADGSAEMVRREFPEARLIALDRNRGFAAGNNVALAEAAGRYLLLLNPDCVLPADALQKLVAFADSRPEAGLVGPKLVYPDGRLQYSCRRFPTLKAAVFRDTVLGRLWPRARAPGTYLMADWDHNEVREVDWLSGACLLARAEDVDWAFRMKAAGWRVLYTPEPVVTHAVGRSTDQVAVRTVLRTHRSMFRLYRKHLCRSPLLLPLVWCGVWLRAFVILAEQFARRVIVRARRPFAGGPRRAGKRGE